MYKLLIAAVLLSGCAPKVALNKNLFSVKTHVDTVVTYDKDEQVALRVKDGGCNTVMLINSSPEQINENTMLAVIGHYLNQGVDMKPPEDSIVGTENGSAALDIRWINVFADATATHGVITFGLSKRGSVLIQTIYTDKSTSVDMSLAPCGKKTMQLLKDVTIKK